jgi:hypothetical protein
MLRIVALVALILALFAVSGCVSGTGGTADQTDGKLVHRSIRRANEQGRDADGADRRTGEVIP